MKQIRLYISALILASGLACGTQAVALPATGGDAAREFAQAQPAVRVMHGAVEVSNPCDCSIDVTVFAITGTIVKQLQIPAGETLTLELPAGYYIIKAGKLSTRVAVK